MAVLSADLSARRYFTYWGGAGEDRARASAISPDLSTVYFGGHTLSTAFPTTIGALDSRLDGLYGAWVAALKLN